jgi:hypothetical protein
MLYLVIRWHELTNLGKHGIQKMSCGPIEGEIVASNYEAICEENRESYGTKGAQKSGKLAAGLYDDRTHFIFELLQNAEDALGRRGEWHGSRKVAFTLNPTRLTLSHFGKPFDEADVRSVCDIAESTKNESSIGRFGLGFKSVYTVTDLPEIHSGDEDFAIENYVFPKRTGAFGARGGRDADRPAPETGGHERSAGHHRQGSATWARARCCSCATLTKSTGASRAARPGSTCATAPKRSAPTSSASR